MYANAASVVIMDGYISDQFPCQVQGCPLSPLLFSLYICDLEEMMLCESTGPVAITEQGLSTLMFSIVADSAVGLQHSLEKYCKKWYKCSKNKC